MKVVCYTNTDGGLSIINQGTKDRIIGTEDENCQRLADKAVAAGLVVGTPVIVEKSAIPTDREFRDAWEHASGVVSVNFAKAIAIQEQRIGEAKILKAREILERETAGENVAAEKAALQAIDARTVRNAQNLDELKASWPAGLKRP